MGNKKKNIARSFKFLWATFFKTMGNEFYAYGQRYFTTSPNSVADEALVIFTWINCPTWKSCLSKITTLF